VIEHIRRRFIEMNWLLGTEGMKELGITREK
jgi:hypothetical protein